MGEVLHPVEGGRVCLLHVVLVHLDDLVVAVQLDAHLPLRERLPCFALLDLTTRGKTISEKFMGEKSYFGERKGFPIEVRVTPGDRFSAV